MVMYSKELFHKKIMKLILLDLENKKENQLKIENVGRYLNHVNQD